MAKPSTVSGVSITALTSSAPETIKISWDTSISPVVVGYNLYRGYIPETGYKANKALITNTYCTTTTELVPDVNFYWFVTAVNSFGEESDPQNIGKTTEPHEAFNINPISNTTDAFNNIAYNDGEDMLDYYNEIRRRLIWRLENEGMQGSLLKRRWVGLPHVKTMTRTAGLTDYISDISLGEKIDIKGIGDAEGNYNYVQGTDFRFYNAYGTTDGASWTYIEWLPGGNSPAGTSNYYVRYQDIHCYCYSTEAGEGYKNCTNCYGTWIQGGYSKFDMKMAIDYSPRKIEFGDTGFIPDYNPVITVPWTAHISTFDYIVDKTTNRRWEIISVVPRHWRGLIIQQDLTVKQMPSTNIVYQFPV